VREAGQGRQLPAAAHAQARPPTTQNDPTIAADDQQPQQEQAHAGTSDTTHTHTHKRHTRTTQLTLALTWQQCEMHGSPMTRFGGPDAEHLPMFVRLMPMRSLTPVGQASFASICFTTKQGHNVRVTCQHQFVYNQRRVVRPSSAHLIEPPILFTHTQHTRHRRNGT
jgi:hypothetical protein